MKICEQEQICEEAEIKEREWTYQPVGARGLVLVLVLPLLLLC
jgi:hypothetical protein